MRYIRDDTINQSLFSVRFLQEAQDSIAMDIVTRLDDEISNQRQTLVVSISVMSAAVFLLILVIVSVHRLTKRLQSFAVNLQVIEDNYDDDSRMLMIAMMVLV